MSKTPAIILPYWYQPSGPKTKTTSQLFPY